jgi:hypothetical protein
MRITLHPPLLWVPARRPIEPCGGCDEEAADSHVCPWQLHVRNNTDPAYYCNCCANCEVGCARDARGWNLGRRRG